MFELSFQSFFKSFESYAISYQLSYLTHFLTDSVLKCSSVRFVLGRSRLPDFLL